MLILPKTGNDKQNTKIFLLLICPCTSKVHRPEAGFSYILMHSTADVCVFKVIFSHAFQLNFTMQILREVKAKRRVPIFLVTEVHLQMYSCDLQSVDNGLLPASS